MNSRLRWFRFALAGQFLLAGGVVMTVAALIVGYWVSNRIEQSVVQNSAVSAALYLESFISPMSGELADPNGLSEPARAALREIFFGTTLGDRVVSYKIWQPGGLVVGASDPDLIGKAFVPSADLMAAWEGVVSASFEDLNDVEDSGEAELGIPLLEVYSPVRAVWTGEIVAVAEFYQHADDLAQELIDVRRTSWLVVAAVFAVSGAMLFGIVQAGGRLIEKQRAALQSQLDETRRMARQNADLRDRVVAAAQRSTAQADRVMQRIGQDLHDGVAQHMSLASLRFEEAKPANAENAETVRTALASAMSELRAISRGLALPDIDNLSVRACINRAIEDHCKAFGTAVSEQNDVSSGLLGSYPVKLCVYRFIQEALANAHRHAGAAKISVAAHEISNVVCIVVADDGSGFDIDNTHAVGLDGGQGLHGLRDRAETLNGSVDIKSTQNRGTTLTLRLPLEAQNP